jgi:hypothetical protein
MFVRRGLETGFKSKAIILCFIKSHYIVHSELISHRLAIILRRNWPSEMMSFDVLVVPRHCVKKVFHCIFFTFELLNLTL